MCLYSAIPKAIKAEKNIPVYKILMQNYKNGPLMTPYTMKNVSNPPCILKGEFRSSSLEDKFENNKEGYIHFYPKRVSDKLIPECPVIVSPDKYKVEEGFIHAYEDVNDAKKTLPTFFYRFVFGNEAYKVFIVKGYIPKGTYYYKDMKNSEICAREIKLESIVLEY